MKKTLKRIIMSIPFYHPIRNWKVKREQEKALVEWEHNGRPAPPPHIIKQQALRNVANEFGLKILVETGTYRGDMVEAMKNDFDRIYSIELSKDLHENAKRRFRGDNKIELIQGDSGIELKNLINRIDQPTLFWLDGHYSAGVTAKGEKVTPIFEELTHIFNIPGDKHVIIIDDARLFGTDTGYPSIDELKDFIKSRRPDFNITIKNDSIQIAAKQ